MQNLLKFQRNEVSNVIKGALIVVLGAAMVGMVVGGIAYRSYAQASQAPAEIKIGVVVNLTGSEGETGREELNGIKLAAEERKEILGHPIVVLAGDATDGKSALSETRRLVTVENVLAVMGTSTSENSYAVPKVTEEYGVPLMELDSWDKVLTEKGYTHYFRVCQTYEVYVETLADRLVDFFAPLLGKKPEELRIAIVHDQWAEGVIGEFKKALKKRGIEPVVVVEAKWDTQNFTPVIEKIRAHEPIDILMPEQIGISAQNFRKQMLALRLNPKMVVALGVGWEEPDFGKQLGAENVEGVFTWSWPTSEVNYPAVNEFGKKYEARFKEPPGTYAPIAYSAANVLFDTIEQVLKEHGTVTRDLLTTALRKVDISTGVLADYWGIKFDEKGNNLRAGGGVVLQWQDGHRVAVYPPELAGSNEVRGY